MELISISSHIRQCLLHKNISKIDSRHAQFNSCVNLTQLSMQRICRACLGYIIQCVWGGVGVGEVNFVEIHMAAKRVNEIPYH